MKRATSRRRQPAPETATGFRSRRLRPTSAGGSPAGSPPRPTCSGACRRRFDRRFPSAVSGPPAPGGCTRDSSTCRSSVAARCAPRRIAAENGVTLRLTERRPARTTDHVLLGTGYRIDVRRYPFLAPELADELELDAGYPVLGPGLESSVAGLHFMGAPAAASFGPIMRFVVGSWYAAPAVARRAADRRQPACQLRVPDEQAREASPALGRCVLRGSSAPVFSSAGARACESRSPRRAACRRRRPAGPHRVR